MLQQPKSHNSNRDHEVQGCPTDCISSLRFSPAGCTHGKTILAVSSWDKSVRLWEVQSNGTNIQTQPVHMYNHDMPALCVCTSKDGRVFSGGCDNIVKCMELGNMGKAPYTVAQHSDPIRHVHWVDEMQVLVTAGWDKTVKFWDARTPNPVGGFQLANAYTDMDCTFPMLTVCDTTEIVVYNLQNRSEMKRTKPHNTMKEQLRCVANFPEVNSCPGFAAGSIEGRVCVMYMQETSTNKNYSFRCHRDTDTNGAVSVYAVHSLSFHHEGTLGACGGNGGYSFWDISGRFRLRESSLCNQPVPVGRFSACGNFYAYAVSYDWAKGLEGYDTKMGNFVLIHRVMPADLKKRYVR